MTRPASMAVDEVLIPLRPPGVCGALLRLSKPGIVLAEILSALAGMLLAGTGIGDRAVNVPTLFAIALAAGGAAMLNGLLDSAADRKMKRLALRCLALERVGPRRLLLVSLLFMGSGLLLISVSATLPAVILLAAGCLSYLALYTAWLKRRSPWGVLAGAIPGALPPLIGMAAVSPGLSIPSLLLALFIFLWQLPHFWFLALDCRDQYALAEIPVLPLTHGEGLTKLLTFISVLLLLPMTFLLSWAGHFSIISTTVVGISGVIFVGLSYRSLYRTAAYRHGFIVTLFYLIIIILVVFGESCISRSL